MIEMVMVISIIGIIVAITVPRFSDASSGRRLSAAEDTLIGDIETIKLRARATGKMHTIQFYPAEELYVVFEGTDIDRNAIVLSRELDADPFSLDLARTTIGGDQRIVVSEHGELEKDFSVGISDGGIEILVAFTGVNFTPPVVTETDTVIEIKTGLLDLKIGF